MTDNVYLDLMQSEEAQRRQQLGASLATGLDINPDAYAAQRRVAGYLGYPVAAVEATPEQSKQEALAKRITKDVAAAPVLARRYTDDDFKKLALDDSGILSQIEGHVGAVTRYVMGANGGGPTLLGDVRGGVNDTAKGYSGAFRALFEVIAPVLDPLENVRSIGGNPLRRLAEGFAEYARTPVFAEDKPTQPVGLVQSGVSSGVRSLVGNVLALPAALLPGGQGASLGLLATQAAGGTYAPTRV